MRFGWIKNRAPQLALPRATVPLTHAQASAVQTAASARGYQVRMFQKTFDGKTVGCVLVGEWHKKLTAKSDAVGKRLVASFRWQGSEGWTPTTLGEKNPDLLDSGVRWVVSRWLFIV